MGRWLHYDHNDDGTGYLGFAHGAPCPHCGIRCNTRAGAVEGNSRSRGTTSQHRRSSRTW